MAKKGMRRPDPSDSHGTMEHPGVKKERNTVKPVPELQGKARSKNKST